MAHSCTENKSNIWKFIIFHHSYGKSIQNIAKLVNLSHSTEQYVINCFREENRIENKIRKGRLKKLTKRDKRFIIKKIVKYPSLSAVKITVEFKKKKFHLKQFDKFSEQLNWMSFLSVENFLLERKTKSLGFYSQY